jgi:hypothetical protein
LFGFTTNAQLLAALNAIAAVQGKQSIQLAAILSQGTKIMSGLTDLQAAVTALAAAVTAEISALQAAAGDPDATVESLAQQINASTAALTASLLPATTAATKP